MKERSREPEIMDLGPLFYTQDEYHECLRQLNRIGRLLRGDQMTLKAMQHIPGPITSILDVGCGGGAFAIKLAHHFKHARVLGIDIAPEAITYASRELASAQAQNRVGDNVEFELRTNPELSEPEKSFDIVTATVVCHHLDDETLITFLQKASLVARKAIVINDLHRHWLAYVGFAFLSSLFFRNRLTRTDGLISIKKGFLRSDWVSLLEKAGFNPQQYRISWCWPFRWVVTIYVDEVRKQNG